jgi:MFS family permease
MKLSYKNYLLFLLMLILAFNYVDRLAVSLVLQDIKIHFHLSDTQLGLLSGLAFALFYSVMGIPIARWADRGNRALVITVTTALWSGAVALCGYASTFVQLLLARVGVAVGEAGCMPPAHSLIADYFPRAERPRAAAVYMQGSNLSVLIGYFLAGWLSQRYGWQTMFKLLGLPGVVLALIAWATLREPRRQPAASTMPTPSKTTTTPPPPRHSLVEVIVTLWNNVTFRYLWLTFSIMNFFSYGVVQWQPTFFIRTFGMSTEALGLWLTLIYGVGGVIGTYLGGMIASRYAKHNEALQLRATGWLYVGYAVVMAGVLLSPNKYFAITLNTLGVLAASLGSGPLFGTIQTVVPERMRGMSISLLYLLGNLIGMGLGPLAAGAMSDFFGPWAGVNSLRYALLTLCPVSLWGSWYLLLAAKTVARDVQPPSAHDAAHQDPNALAAGYAGCSSEDGSYT